VPAGGHEHPVARDPLAALELEHDPLTGPLGADRLGAGTNLDAETGEGRRGLLADERLLAREEAIEELDDHDLGAERAPGLRHLHADTPPPRTISRDGISLMVVTSRFVQLSTSARPTIGAGALPEPTAITTASRASSTSPFTRTRRSPSSRPCPRTSSMPRESTHSTWPSSSRP